MTHATTDQDTAASDEPELDAKTRQRMFESAVRMLANREHSCAELEQKLLRKFGRSFDVEVASVVAELREHGLVDDQRFIEVLVRSRINRGYGPFYIQQELKSKGMSAQRAEEVEAWQDADWYLLASDLLERKFGRDQCSREARTWHKAMRFLQRRGFAGQVVYDVLPDMPKS